MVISSHSIALTLAEGGEHVRPASFLKAGQAFMVVLGELDAAVSGEGSGALSWAISDLAMGSSVTIGVTGIARDDRPNHGPAVIAACIRGLAELEEAAVRPQYFSDRALQAAKELPQPLAGEVRQVSIRGAGRQINVTQHVAANVDEVLGQTYLAPSSVEGRLEAVSIHDRLSFGVWEPVEHRRVECRFREDMLEEVRSALGRRVLVTGDVRFTASGEPLRVQVESIRVFPEEDALPRTEDLAGLAPDLTGGMDSADYVRRMRDGRH